MLQGVRRFHDGAEHPFDRHALEDRHGALDLGPSQFLDQDWPAELGVIMMAGCGRGPDRLCPGPSRRAAGAAAEDGCRHFAWPVDRELELFADGFVADVESESALPKDGVFALLLQPVADVIYLVPPERGRDDGLGGVVTLEWISAGRYQMTLSGEAWIDAVQNERRLPMLRLEPRRRTARACASSVQFEVDSLPLTLQIGGATVAAPQYRGAARRSNGGSELSTGRLGYGGGMSFRSPRRHERPFSASSGR